MSQCFEILIFSQNIWGNVHYVPEINHISCPNKTILKKSEARFCRLKTAEDNAKISVFPNIPCTFLNFKTSAFFQVFFSRIFFSDKFSKRQFFAIVNV